MTTQEKTLYVFVTSLLSIQSLNWTLILPPTISDSYPRSSQRSPLTPIMTLQKKSTISQCEQGTNGTCPSCPGLVSAEHLIILTRKHLIPTVQKIHHGKLPKTASRLKMVSTSNTRGVMTLTKLMNGMQQE